MRTLQNMIDFLKGKTEKVVEDIKRMPKVNPRGVYEVSEDSIATISIKEIQRIFKEDVKTIMTSQRLQSRGILHKHTRTYRNMQDR